jgi:hypothetical protein
MVLTSTRAKAITEPEERCLIHLVQDGDNRALEHCIFQGAHPEGTFPTAGLGHIPTADGLCPIAPLMHPPMHVLKPWLHVLPLCFPRDPVCARGGIPLQCAVRLPHAVHRAVVEEGGEPLGWMLTDRLSSTTQPLGHACPALRPVRVVWRPIPLGHRPSLPLLRRPLGSVVRKVLRYYVGV